MNEPGDDVLRSSPMWLRRPEVLVTGSLAVSMLAALVEAARVFALGAGVFAVIGLLVTVAGAILARRLFWVGLGATILGSAAAAAAGWNPIVEWTIVVFTLFAGTFRGASPLRAVPLAALPLFVIVALEAHSGPLSPDVLAAVFACIAGGAAGAGLHSQRQYWNSLLTRAQDALATREEEARRRVSEERLRIARDLHDIVGHQVAVASMHLGAVEVTIHREPDVAAKAAEDARVALRAVTTETQQILELLRSGDGTVQADYTVAGFATIVDLVASYEGSGLRVDFTMVDPLPEADPAIGMTAYRIVQEALTNAYRYGSGTARVQLVIEANTLVITVTNPIPGKSSQRSGSGFGLLGMRERVSAAGGKVDAYDGDGSLFTVRASLPLDGRRTL
ncbi:MULTISPECIES: sensor histidine kinase [unclassified Frondihabitans]|uniref:sensor histidine kinase n=1 Tax=unclassified Frondihabitans TaxID=2626248 RepID=UPI00131580E5|nr:MULTISPECIES: sensor histidine kinase [unclassified Frondihabitans]